MVDTSTAPRPHSKITTFAKITTDVTSVGVLVAVQVALAAWHSASDASSALSYGALAVTFASIIPMAYVFYGTHFGDLVSHHIPVRQRRLIPMCVGLASLTVGALVLALIGAPAYLVNVMVMNVAGLAMLTAITLSWKISAHTSTTAATITMLVFVFGPPALIATPAVLLTGWSRLHLRAHTRSQVVIGAILGAAVNAGLHLAL
ncbi:phosphatase PAP2 family protein [Actinoplanes sp. NEAU-A12]|uniref:Phosphatase PAP2 family protein n=1 Tax=Actinoplanes sandaracinus TaxID=3045177 RepID=A0ABT6WSD2_9ACTN|nr:phosphatase PAP2 family protein [Actinoplanes sandaracinus]MDI6102647.1 phosphatase PAP2 family protein [Actinoplanes sandaracinus]